MDRLIDLCSVPVQTTLKILLKDKTTKKNIIWATDTYNVHGIGFQASDEITAKNISGLNSQIIQTRAAKSQEEQKKRTRFKAEVMTPSWLCNKMNNYADEEWFGFKNVFNYMDEHTWHTKKEPINFTGLRTWQKYIDSRCMEITCGEAPFLVSRYDTVSGNMIVPPILRIGELDQKMRVVTEHTTDYPAWVKWATRAFQSCYGFEYQGDSLLIARINMLMSFCEYHEDRWNKSPDATLLRKIANIIAWNVWQMDGLKGLTPLGAPYRKFRQLTLWDLAQPQETENSKVKELPCVIKNWRSNKSLNWEDQKMGKKLFDFCIGNPPYQGANDLNGRQPPVYHQFMDAAYQVAKCTELITPARFLFNAGQTPKEWNRKMLNDSHFKVLEYEPDATTIFPNTDIKGGVSISIHNDSCEYGAIEVFTKYENLNSIIRKVASNNQLGYLDEIISPRGLNRLSDSAFAQFPFIPQRLGKGTGNMIASNVFDKLPEIFTSTPGKNDIKVLGRFNNSRVYRYISEKFLIGNPFIHTYNLAVPKSNGSGEYGETLVSPEILPDGTIATDTFIAIGMFKTQTEAEALNKYYRTKFFRALLGVYKVTQDNPKSAWKAIPIQDFSDTSEINWEKPINSIDQQLYSKYGLNKAEIDFIESHVKEMS